MSAAAQAIDAAEPKKKGKGKLILAALVLLLAGGGAGLWFTGILPGLVGMGEGTIYPLMRRMQSDGLVTTYLEESSSGPPRKYYQLTKAGRAALVAQKADWTDFTASVAKILADAKPGSHVTRAVGGAA